MKFALASVPTDSRKMYFHSCICFRQYSTINISADKWLLTMNKESIEKLDSPPSLADGIDLETEKVMLIFELLVSCLPCRT